jgi:predicted acylesterase/phospholipase RssA
MPHPLAGLALIAALCAAGCAQTPIRYPAPDCGDRDANGEPIETSCIARLLPPTQEVATKAHLPAAGVEIAGVPGLCIPRNYLELWHPGKRRESEQSCYLDAGALEGAGRFFDCIHTREDGCKRPEIGITLEGGGTKSAPFSLGVLAGLHRSGVLDRTDMVGSASGGSYAAYFYFARLMERESLPEGAEVDESAWFRDCMPSYYRMKGVVPPSLLRDADFCKELDEATGVFHKLLEGNEYERAFEYQYQPRVGRDLLAFHQSLRLRRDGFHIRDLAAPALGVSALAAAHVATVVPHLITNGLFDWPVNYSPSREAYKSGIERAYGYSAKHWHQALRLEDLAFSDPEPNGEWVGTRFERPWWMKDLEESYVRAHSRGCENVRTPCKFPLWVLSTASSAGRSHDFWIKPQPRDFQRFSFEISPRGHGSGLLGFLDVPPLLPLRGAVVASAAFLDDQQRAIAQIGVIRTVASSLIFAFNLNWGANIANFNVSDWKRAGTSMTPFPGYWLPAFQGLRAGHIHLADGGNVDNLGLVSLLRRGTRNIVVSASTDDARGEFPSLCKLKNELELQIPWKEGQRERQSVYNILVPALVDLDQVCNIQLGKQEFEVWGDAGIRTLVCDRLGQDTCDAEFRKVKDGVHAVAGYNFWNWPIPVLDACVVLRPALEPGDHGRPRRETCAEARQAGRELSRLFLIKPVMSSPTAHLRQTVDGVIRRCVWGNDGLVRGDPQAPGDTPAGMDLPCIALAYVSRVPPGEQKCGSLRNAFPQDEFIGMTLHAGYTLYDAYYDLGRHLGAQVRPAEAAKPCGSTLCVAHPPDERTKITPCPG